MDGEARRTVDALRRAAEVLGPESRASRRQRTAVCHAIKLATAGVLADMPTDDLVGAARALSAELQSPDYTQWAAQRRSRSDGNSRSPPPASPVVAAFVRVTAELRRRVGPKTRSLSPRDTMALVSGAGAARPDHGAHACLVWLQGRLCDLLKEGVPSPEAVENAAWAYSRDVRANRVAKTLADHVARRIGAFEPARLTTIVWLLSQRHPQTARGLLLVATERLHHPEAVSALPTESLVHLLHASAKLGYTTRTKYSVVCRELATRQLSELGPVELTYVAWAVAETYGRLGGGMSWERGTPKVRAGDPGVPLMEAVAADVASRVDAFRGAQLAAFARAMNAYGLYSDPAVALQRVIAQRCVEFPEEYDSRGIGQIVSAANDTLRNCNASGNTTAALRLALDGVLGLAASRICASRDSGRSSVVDRAAFSLNQVRYMLSTMRGSNPQLRPSGAATKQLAGDLVSPFTAALVEALRRNSRPLDPAVVGALSVFCTRAMSEVEAGLRSDSGLESGLWEVIMLLSQTVVDAAPRMSLAECIASTWGLTRFQSMLASTQGHTTSLTAHRQTVTAQALAALHGRALELLRQAVPSETRASESTSVISPGAQSAGWRESSTVGTDGDGNDIRSIDVVRVAAAFSSPQGEPEHAIGLLRSLMPLVPVTLPVISDLDLVQLFRAHMTALVDEHASASAVLASPELSARSLVPEFVDVLERMTGECVSRLDAMEPEHLVQLVWAHAALGFMDAGLFERALSGYKLHCHSFTHSQKRMLYQAHLSCVLEAPFGDTVRLPLALETDFHNSVLKLTREISEAHNATSTMHRQVSRILLGMGINHQNELLLPDTGYVVDIALTDSRVAIEVQGPTHYGKGGQHRKLEAGTCMKNRHLRALDWTVINVPWWDYAAAREADGKHGEVFRRTMEASLRKALHVAI